MLAVELNRANFEYDVNSIVKAFYPEEQVSVLTPGVGEEKRQILQEHVKIRIVLQEDGAELFMEGRAFLWNFEGNDFTDPKEFKYGFKRFLYHTLSQGASLGKSDWNPSCEDCQSAAGGRKNRTGNHRPLYEKI